MLPIVPWSPCPHTEIDGTTPSQARPPAIINLSPLQFGLRDGSVAPVVAGGHHGGVTFGEALKGDIVVGAAGVEEEDGEVGEGAGEAGGEEGARCAA